MTHLSIEIFQREEVPQIMEYVIDKYAAYFILCIVFNVAHSYYRRYKLLKYSLTDKLIVNIKQTHPQEVEECGGVPALAMSVHYEDGGREE